MLGGNVMRCWTGLVAVFPAAGLEDGQLYVRLRRSSYNGSPVKAVPKHGPLGMAATGQRRDWPLGTAALRARGQRRDVPLGMAALRASGGSGLGTAALRASGGMNPWGRRH